MTNRRNYNKRAFLVPKKGWLEQSREREKVSVLGSGNKAQSLFLLCSASKEVERATANYLPLPISLYR